VGGFKRTPLLKGAVSQPPFRFFLLAKSPTRRKDREYQVDEGDERRSAGLPSPANGRSNGTLTGRRAPRRCEWNVRDRSLESNVCLFLVLSHSLLSINQRCWGFHWEGDPPGGDDRRKRVGETKQSCADRLTAKAVGASGVSNPTRREPKRCFVFSRRLPRRQVGSSRGEREGCHCRIFNDESAPGVGRRKYRGKSRDALSHSRQLRDLARNTKPTNHENHP
jgi:hypothetical protein